MIQDSIQKALLTKAVTKALAYQENGGKPNLEQLSAGKTGEMKSIFQFLPTTWKGYAQDILGDANAPATPENELKVTLGKVGNWIDEGKTAGQIASIWNSGNENRYKQNWKGINNGVAYDTPKYAQNVINYAKKFYNEEQQKQLGNSMAPDLTQSSSFQTPSTSTLPNLARANSTPAVPQAPIVYQAPQEPITPLI